MYNVYQLALRAESYEPSLTRLPYGKLTIVVGEDEDGNDVSFRAIAYGDTSRAPESDEEYKNTYGSELVIQNPNGTQAMAIDIMNQIKGYAYQPYSARSALVPIEADLGDVVRIADDQSIIAVQDFYFDGLAASDISAPGGDETDNEFGLYESQAEKARKRSDKELRASFIVELGRIESSLEENYQKKSDMSRYVETASLNTSIGQYIDSTAGTAKVVSAASGVYQRKDQMSNYVLTSSLNTSIGQYIDSQAGQAKIISAAASTYQRKDAMSGYVTTSSLNTSIGQYIDTQAGQAKIVSAVSGTYQTISGMSSYVTKSSLDASITAHINTQAGIAEVTSAVSATYQRKDAMGNYVQNSQLNNSITQYVNSSTGKNTIVASVSGSFAGKSYESRVEVSESKIGWLIKSGTSASNFTMTDRAIQLTAGSIDLTGYVTFNSLTDQGATSINGSNITTGTINADLIDANRLRVTGIYSPRSSLPVVFCVDPNQAQAKVQIGTGDSSSYTGARVQDVEIRAQRYVTIGRENITELVFDCTSGPSRIYPDSSGNQGWTLGKPSNPFEDVFVSNITFQMWYDSVTTYYRLTLSEGGTGTYTLTPSADKKMTIGNASYRLSSIFVDSIEANNVGGSVSSVAFKTKYGSTTHSLTMTQTASGVVFTPDTDNYYEIGSSTRKFKDVFLVSAHIGDNSSNAKIGFFGTTPIAKQTLSTSSANMGYTSATASNYLVILNNVVGILSKKYGMFAS